MISECVEGQCNFNANERTISGCCNNINNIQLGKANRAFTRLLNNTYEDNISLPRGGLDPSTLPNPRDVTTAVHRNQIPDDNPPVSLMLFQFAQFVDHDITLTPEQGELKSAEKPF